MKIRLIQPTQLDVNGNPIKFKKLMMPTLALPTIAALTPNGIDVEITEEYVEDIDFDEDVDLVGITALTCQAPRAYQIADEFRKRGTKTIIGGSHASACPEETLQHFNSVLVGEAEDVWEQIIEDVKSNNLKRVYQKPQRPDLSRLAIPRFDLIDYKNHMIAPFERTPLIPIQATRGCPHNCDFCSVTRFFGRRIRKKPVAHVVREIEVIRPSRIFFVDDNISADPRYAKELFEAIRPLRIRWACQMSTTIMKHPELIKLAAKAGCYETFIGIESINEETLKSLNKTFNQVSEYKELFKRFKDVGILGQAPLIVGVNGDTADSLRKAIDTALTWDISYLYICLITPLPGTKFYQRMKAEGRILSEDWSLYDTVSPLIRMDELTSEELMERVWEGYQKFYSLTNIFKRVWRFKKQYICFFPRDFVIENLFFDLLIRNSVRMKKHPFSLGLEVRK